MWNRMGQWLRAVLLRGRLEREMQEEMAAHLAQSSERLQLRGLSAEEAQRAARREFGNVAYLQEQARDARGARWVESILADLRFGLRHFGRTPFSTLTMIVLLALGIGFNAGLFTFFHSMLTQAPPGIERSESLVRIRGAERSQGWSRGREFSYPEFREYAAQRQLFSAVAAWTSSDVVIDVGERQQELHSAAATYVTSNYFQVLRVRPALGAGLPVSPAADNGAPQLVAVISDALWQRYLGAAPDVLGRTVKVNDVLVTIVGVAPERFAGARTGGSQIRLWLPLNARPQVQRSSASALASYDSSFLGLAARLQPGVAASQALPAVEAIAARAAQQTRRNSTISTEVVTLRADNYFPPSGEPTSIVGRVTSLLIPLLILLICCTNVSALLVGLAVARRREIAVRLSLGAARRRIVRQLITESVLLALLAAGLGLLVIAALLNIFGSRFPDIQLVLHWPAFLFTFGLAAVTGILFGVSPALHATRLAVSDVLKDSAAGVVATHSRLQSLLVTGQIALTQPLLLGTGALILSLIADLQRLTVSPHGERIAQVSFNVNPRYGTLNENREELLQRVQSRIAALPGVEAVVPQKAGDDYQQVSVHPGDRVGGVEYRSGLSLRMQAAAPGYFELMGFPLLRGRGFTHSDEDAGSIVIRSDLARRLWGDADPIGRRLVTPAATLTVVGMIDEARAGRSGDNELQVFVPGRGTTGSILVRTRGPAQPMIPLIRSIAQREAPTQPVTSVTTLAAIENRQRSLATRATAGVTAVGLVALFLCAIGLYTVVAFAVGQRTREIGIRAALGADPRKVAGMFFLRGLRLSFVGLLIGLTLSLIVQRLLAAAQGQTPAQGLLALALLIAAVVVGVASVATWVPARRAAGVDPLMALRSE